MAVLRNFLRVTVYITSIVYAKRYKLNVNLLKK